MKWITLVLMILAMTSCTKNKCSDMFVNDYKAMGLAFQNLYKENATQDELNAFRSSMEKFIGSHKDVECKIDGAMVNPTSEVSSMLSELDEVMKLIAKVIYGQDNRMDVMDSPIERYREWANSTAAHIPLSEMDASYTIKSESLGSSIGLCPGERFYNQFSAARCSGFLVGTDTIVTAGHCMQYESDCSNIVWAFGYYKGVTQLKQEDVYRCKRVIKQELQSNGLDYAVVQLDRPVKDRKFFRYRNSGKISDSANLVVIGHPSGLPTKIADGAVVRTNDNEYWFSSNLDTFGGNSGSAVIDSDSGVVEGILVRGETDYVTSSVNGSTCYKVNVCSNSGCGGEEVTRMTKVQGIPSILNVDSIMNGLFDSRNLPTVESGVRIKTLGYSYNGYTVAGRKFLDVCGVHVYKDEQPKWLFSGSGSCESQKSVIGDFLKLLQL